jgi:hypothetical protein
MSCRSATSHPCVVWRRVDGSPDTVAASRHNSVKSRCTVAYPLRVTSRSVSYCRRLAVSMSYTHLMRCLLRVLGETMMCLMPGALRTHEHASKAESHGTYGDTRALSHREAGLGRGTRGDTGVLPCRAVGPATHGDVRALTHREVGLEPRDT